MTEQVIKSTAHYSLITTSFEGVDMYGVRNNEWGVIEWRGAALPEMYASLDLLEENLTAILAKENKPKVVQQFKH